MSLGRHRGTRTAAGLGHLGDSAAVELWAAAFRWLTPLQRRRIESAEFFTMLQDGGGTEVSGPATRLRVGRPPGENLRNLAVEAISLARPTCWLCFVPASGGRFGERPLNIPLHGPPLVK